MMSDKTLFAFPFKVVNTSGQDINAWGSKIPAGHSFFDPGMTLRDYFAASALQGILSAGIGINVGPSHTEEMEGVAKTIYLMADSMIAARDQ